MDCDCQRSGEDCLGSVCFLCVFSCDSVLFMVSLFSCKLLVLYVTVGLHVVNSCRSLSNFRHFRITTVIVVLISAHSLLFRCIHLHKRKLTGVVNYIRRWNVYMRTILRGCDNHTVMAHFKASSSSLPLRVDPAVLYYFSTFQVQAVLSQQ